MRSNPKVPRIITRRDTLKVCLLPAGTITTAWLLGCSSSSNGRTIESGGATGSGGAAGTGGATPPSNGGVPARAGAGGTPASTGSGGAPPAGGATPITGGAPSSGGVSGAGGTAGTGGASGAAGQGGSGGIIVGDGGVAGPGVPWATGGTKSIHGPYPDPFGNGATSCILYPAQTIGPCYAQSPMMREDISDGLGGLPMRLSFLVTKKDGCTPVPNATVDIWHSGSNGIYSAYAMGTVCNPGMDNVLMDMFCRGVQTTNADGRVDFSTVFPGWYKGRTIHIHFTIRLNGRESVTSQLYFPDTLTNEILAQGDYAVRGMRDTNNTTDTLFLSGGATAAQVLFDTAKRPDGGLHAWKILSIS